jgi:hypothetical protein
VSASEEWALTQFLAAVELVCCRKGALFHLVEDDLHVNELPLFEVKSNPGPEKFFGQQGEVEFIGVVPGKVTAFKGSNQGGCNLLKSGHPATSSFRMPWICVASAGMESWG